MVNQPSLIMNQPSLIMNQPSLVVNQLSLVVIQPSLEKEASHDIILRVQCGETVCVR
jgi:hypothetical protein